jgi:hypothetical protein
VYTVFWWENLKERDHVENLGGIILKWTFREWDGTWTVVIWLRTGTDGGFI